MQRLIEKIEAAGFQCEAGPLTMSQDWLLLKAELGLEGLLRAEKAEPGPPPCMYSMDCPLDHCSKGPNPRECDQYQAEDLYNQAVQVVREVASTSTSGIVSISAIQRRLRLGYNRSSRLVVMMEQGGVVTAPDNQGRRKVIGHEPPQPCSCGDHK